MESKTTLDAMTSNPLNSWLDGQDVMQMLHISQRTLQTWRSTGKIGFSKVGRKIYYKASEIDRLLSEGYTRLTDREDEYEG